MSHQIGTTRAKRRVQNLGTLHYHVLSTLFPLLGSLDDQHSEFLKSWMAYLDFKEFPNLIKYYTTIGTSTILKEEYNTIKECTLLKDTKYFMYLTQLYFSDNTPNQILHILSTLLLWMKNFLHHYSSISYPILFLGHHTQRKITLELLPNVSQQMSETENFMTYTTTTITVLCITCMIQVIP